MRRRIVSTTSFRLFSTSSISSTSNNTNNALPTIIRHGQNDGVITLNVGGKNFQTLRSTIAQNEVLMDHVVRAENNMEETIISGSTTNQHAIFIDRDPKHFDMILTYLRNKADGIYRQPGIAQRLMKSLDGKSSSGSSSNGANNCGESAKEATKEIAKSISTTTSILLPKDSKTLTEMYFESIHYRIPELTDCICSKQSFARAFELLGSSNPIKDAGTLLKAGSRILIALGGVVTTGGAWLYTQYESMHPWLNSKAEWAQEKTTQLFLKQNDDNVVDGISGERVSPKEQNNDVNLDNDLAKETAYWSRQAQYWKHIADKWRGS